MKRTREEMLEEMGLAVWRSRETPHTMDVEPAPPPVVAEAAPTPALVTPPSAAPVAPAKPAMTGDRAAAIMHMDWPELKAAVAQCTSCALHARRTNTVFGVGDENADWMFVGEG